MQFNKVIRGAMCQRSDEDTVYEILDAGLVLPTSL
jgi:hypothetical protein